MDEIVGCLGFYNARRLQVHEKVFQCGEDSKGCVSHRRGTARHAVKKARSRTPGPKDEFLLRTSTNLDDGRLATNRRVAIFGSR